jgi:phage gpG-like protein
MLEYKSNINNIVLQINKELPLKIGELLENEFKENIRNEIDVNGVPFTPKSEDDSYDLLNKSGELIKSISFDGRNTISVDTVYAEIQNYGGTIEQTLTEKQKKFFWSKYYQTNNSKYKKFALSKKISIKIPARQFAGKGIKTYQSIKKALKKYFN